VQIIRHIAYDAALFVRAVRLLEYLSLKSHHNIYRKAAEKSLVSLFQWRDCGTMAPPGQRFELIEQWLSDPSEGQQHMGRAALKHAIAICPEKTYHAAFGARPRNQGYKIETVNEFVGWFGRILDLVHITLQSSEPNTSSFGCQLLVDHLRSLWGIAELRTRIESLMLGRAESRFWFDGWRVCQDIARHNDFEDEGKAAINVLLQKLAPQSLENRILAATLPGALPVDGKLPSETHDDYVRRINQEVIRLGEHAATDLYALRAVLPHLLRTNGRSDRFGAGLARDRQLAKQIWGELQLAWKAVTPDQRNPSVLYGFMEALAAQDAGLANRFLDGCLKDPELIAALPAIQEAVGLDEKGIQRLQLAFEQGSIPTNEFRFLMRAGLKDEPVWAAARKLLRRIATLPQSDAFDTVTWVLGYWLTIKEGDAQALEAIRPLCVVVLQNIRFANPNDYSDTIMHIASNALIGSDGPDVAARLAQWMRKTAQTDLSAALNHQEVLNVLFDLQPLATLNALYDGTEREREAIIELLEAPSEHRQQPMASLNPAVLLRWCEQQPSERFDFAAKIIPALQGPLGTVRRLTPLALALLRNAPTPRVVLGKLIDQIEPRSWSGSKAAIMEHNLAAIDEIADWFDTDFQKQIRDEKTRLAAYIENRRIEELARERERDERFE
jgi:hypothetical protein